MMLKKILEGRPFGHPIHTFVVHLPLGLWLLGAVLDVVNYAFDSQRWALVGAAWCIGIGTAVALLAVVTGLNDWLDIRADHPAQKSALWHMAMMLPATVLFAVNTLLHFAQRQEQQATTLMVALSVVGYLLATVGGYLGGLLVYDDGISVGRHRRTTELPQNTIREPRQGTSDAPPAPNQGAGEEFHPLIPESALAEGQTIRAEIRGTVLTLIRAQGQIHAVQEFCTHRCGPLSEGQVCGNEIRCPWHNSLFDLATGKVTRGPAKVDLKTYGVRIKNGIIHVNVDTPAHNSTSPGTDRPERRNPEESPSYAREGQREPSPQRRAPAE